MEVQQQQRAQRARVRDRRSDDEGPEEPVGGFHPRGASRSERAAFDQTVSRVFVELQRPGPAELWRSVARSQWWEGDMARMPERLPDVAWSRIIARALALDDPIFADMGNAYPRQDAHLLGARLALGFMQDRLLLVSRELLALVKLLRPGWRAAHTIQAPSASQAQRDRRANRRANRCAAGTEALLQAMETGISVFGLRTFRPYQWH